MSNEQRLSIVGLVLAAVVAGLLIASFAFGAFGGSSATPSPSLAASVSPSPSSSASPSPSATSSPTALPSPTAAPSQTPAPTTSPTAPGTAPAAATLMALKLDATDNADGQDREITFEAIGDGPVLARVIVGSTNGQAVMCLASPQQDLGCTTTSDGQLSADHTGDPTDYTLTLRGDASSEPIVDVTVSFPSDAPEIKIANARFDGTEFPDTNGIQVQVAPRTAGDLGLSAEWGGHPLLYEIDLTGQSSSDNQALDNQGPATGVDTSFPIKPPGAWELVLRNAEVGFGVTGLNASISWP